MRSRARRPLTVRERHIIVGGRRVRSDYDAPGLLEQVLNLGTSPGQERGRFEPTKVTELLVMAANNSTETPSWQTLMIPRNAGMVTMMAIGGGGGGGAGFGGATAGGGSGGGSGAVTRLTAPARYLPQVLYYLIGPGGQGVPASGGTAGSRSFISFAATAVTGNLVIASGTAAAGAGAVGTSGAPGAAASGETIFPASSAPFASMGTFTSIAGQNSAAGGGVAPTNGANVTWGNFNVITCGGPGGGGATTSTGSQGGQIIGAGIVNSVTASSVAGSYLLHPFVSWAGTGGAGVNSVGGGTGGIGGSSLGAFGCGGGGGGAGSTTGAPGGAGGPGLIYIAWW